MLSIVKPFDVNDKVVLLNTNGSILIEGVIKSMNVRHVAFLKPDGKVAFVSNNTVDSCVIMNSNTMNDNGFEYKIECSYDSDIEKAIEIVIEKIKECPFTIEKNVDEYPSAKVRCAHLNPNGYEIKTYIWAKTLNDNFDAVDWLNRNIPKEWNKNKISIPYNIVEIITE